MARKSRKIINNFFKPFLYIGGSIPISQIYGPTLLLAVRLRDLDAVSYITKNQNMYAISEKTNHAITTSSLFYPNGTTKVHVYDHPLRKLKLEEIKLNNAILGKLIFNDGGGICFATSNCYELIEQLVRNKDEDKIYDLFMKNKSTIKNAYSLFVILVYSCSDHFPHVINKVYNFLKKDGIGDELVEPGIISTYYDLPEKYKIPLFSHCLSNAPDEVLIDMLSSMKSIKPDNKSLNISNISKRESISSNLLYAILKKGVREEDILRTMASFAEDTPIEYCHEHLMEIRPDMINALNKARALLSKDFLSNKLKSVEVIKTSEKSNLNKNIEDVGVKKVVSYNNKRKRQFKM